MELAVRAGEMVDLQLRDLLGDRRCGGQQRRHRDHACAALAGMPASSSRPGSDGGAERPRRQPVDAGDGRIGGRHEAGRREQQQSTQRRSTPAACSQSGDGEKDAATATTAPP